MSEQEHFRAREARRGEEVVWEVVYRHGTWDDEIPEHVAGPFKSCLPAYSLADALNFSLGQGAARKLAELPKAG